MTNKTVRPIDRRDVGDEGCRHQPLPDQLAVQAGLDQHRVDDGQARRRERKAADLCLTARPVEGVEAEQADDGERREEADQPDRERRPPLAPELRHVHLGAGEEGQHDPGERADEGQPARHVEMEGVPDHDAEKQLDQGDRDPDLDRHR